jgi:hypothetical protein
MISLATQERSPGMFVIFGQMFANDVEITVRVDRLRAPVFIVVQNGGRSEPHKDLEFNTRNHAGADFAARV